MKIDIQDIIELIMEVVIIKMKQKLIKYKNVFSTLIGWILVTLIFKGVPNYWNFFCTSHFTKFNIFDICTISAILEGILLFTIFIYYIKYSLEKILFILVLIIIILNSIYYINTNEIYSVQYINNLLGFLVAYTLFFLIRYNQLPIYKNIKNINLYINILYVLIILNGLFIAINIGGLYILLSCLIFFFVSYHYRLQLQIKTLEDKQTAITRPLAPDYGIPIKTKTTTTKKKSKFPSCCMEHCKST